MPLALSLAFVLDPTIPRADIDIRCIIINICVLSLCRSLFVRLHDLVMVFSILLLLSLLFIHAMCAHAILPDIIAVCDMCMPMTVVPLNLLCSRSLGVSSGTCSSCSSLFTRSFDSILALTATRMQLLLRPLHTMCSHWQVRFWMDSLASCVIQCALEQTMLCAVMMQCGCQLNAQAHDDCVWNCLI